MSALATVKTKYILAGIASCLTIGLICLSAGLGIRSYSSKTIKSKSRALLRTEPFSSNISSTTPVDIITTTAPSNDAFTTSSSKATTRRTTTPKTTRRATKMYKARTKKVKSKSSKRLDFYTY